MADYSKIIAEADGDLPFGDCVSADINYRKELVIEYITTDCRIEIESKKLATVDRDDTAKMAAFLNVPIEQLPQRILDECGDTRGVCTPSEIKGIFKDVLEYILDCGVRYALK
jgi:hypothetical protein